jgi:hypothetical protein
MCRACNVDFLQSDNLHYICTWVNHNEFDEIVSNILDSGTDANIRRQLYNELHQHIVKNAFQDVDFASFPQGIFGCTPHDLMHAFWKVYLIIVLSYLWIP